MLLVQLHGTRRANKSNERSGVCRTRGYKGNTVIRKRTLETELDVELGIQSVDKGVTPRTQDRRERYAGRHTWLHFVETTTTASGLHLFEGEGPAFYFTYFTSTYWFS